MNIQALRVYYEDVICELSGMVSMFDFSHDMSRDKFRRLAKDIHKRFNFSYDYGETKGVILDFEQSIALKIPFIDDCSGCDYCRAEVRNYRAAVEDNLDQFFCPCEKLCVIDMGYRDIPIYVMPLVDCDQEDITDKMYSWADQYYTPIYEDDKDQLNSIMATFSSGDETAVSEWLEALFPYEYGRLESFLFDNMINDIHAGNLGYEGDSLVIIDYSGYGLLEHSELPKDWYSKYSIQCINLIKNLLINMRSSHLIKLNSDKRRKTEVEV